ncbi:MAG TPA: PLP-dependent aspartate aminotransferase family protein [Armatimonadota bacterium]|nr:PLP-dependent aspartate aminotransferase family protein [Armatimonadota bacterium]
MRFSTKAIHAGQAPDISTGAAIPPLYLSTIYEYETPGETKAGFEYARYGSPTRAALETCLAALENAPENCPALCFSSGMAAIDATLRLLRPGERLLIADETYGGVYKLAEDLIRPMGVDVAYFDATDLGALAAALTPRTRLVWLESPSNPLLKITDLSAAAIVAHAAGSLVAVDSTFATPYFQNPLDLGIDLVMHSSTKYLGGHTDLLGGVLVTRDLALRRRLYEIQKATGAVAAPFDCWLTLRGVKTLAARMRLHEENAILIARFLRDHPRVVRVDYPGLPDFPQYALAARQMRGFGGMVTFEVDGGETVARGIMQKTRVFLMAVSLGGVESIISYPALMSHATVPRAERLKRGITDGLIRLSVGLEDPADLLADLEEAMR